MTEEDGIHEPAGQALFHSSFGLRISFGIRHSGFVIVPRVSLPAS